MGGVPTNEGAPAPAEGTAPDTALDSCGVGEGMSGGASTTGDSVRYVLALVALHIDCDSSKSGGGGSSSTREYNGTSSEPPTSRLSACMGAGKGSLG